MTSKDEKWLQIFINNHSTRLSNEQFERMIKLLETANYEEYRRHHLTTTGNNIKSVIYYHKIYFYIIQLLIFQKIHKATSY